MDKIVARIVSGYSGDPDSWDDKEIKTIDTTHTKIGDILVVSDHSSWVQMGEYPISEIDVDVRLICGSTLKGCIRQDNGDFYWQGCGQEISVPRDLVLSWKRTELS